MCLSFEAPFQLPIANAGWIAAALLHVRTEGFERHLQASLTGVLRGTCIVYALVTVHASCVHVCREGQMQTRLVLEEYY